MASREIVLRMRAETGQYEAGMKRSAAATKGVADAADATSRRAGGALSTLSGSIRDNRAAWDDLSSKAMAGGAAIVGGLGLAAKAAIDWESAWAGVAKTVDGTDTQMAELEAGLRGLARELPATHAEIAGVAEAAGQLGVAREDILGFTETAIALGESTNLSAEEAATSLAQFSNIMGTVAREGVEGYEKLGSTLVELGNNGASTEKQIMEMGLRLAGAGQQIGATEADILAMANALSSVGIEAELGGGAMSRGLLQMNSAVIEGGDKLEKFAEIAGMTASEFAAKWRADPIAAANEFIGGLGRIGDSGGDAAGALAEVGLKGTQNAQVFLRAAGASDLMTASLKMGAEAWDANTALQEEATKRYETDASRIQVAVNRMKDAGISLGSSLAPILAAGAEKVAGLADAFGRLPGPAQSVVAGVGAVAGSALLIGGASVKAIGGLQDLRSNLDQIGALSPRVDSGIRGASRALVGLTAAFTGLQIAGRVVAAFEGDLKRIGSQQLIRDLDGTSDSIAAIDAAIAKASNGKSDVVDLDSAMKSAFDPSWFESAFQGMDAAFSLFGMEKRGGIAQATERFKELDGALADMVSSGNVAGAKEQFQEIAERAKEQGISVKELSDRFPQYAEALAAAENASGGAAEGMDSIGAAADDAAEATDELSKAIKGLGDTMLAQEASEDGYFATLSEVNRALQENGATLSKTTEAGRENRAALRDLATSTQEWAAASIEAGGSAQDAQAILDKGRQSYIDTAVAMGMPKDEAKALADELFKIPDEVKTDFTATGMSSVAGQATQLGLTLGGVSRSASDAKTNVLDLDTSIQTLDGKTVTVEEAGANASQIRVRELDGALIGLPAGKTVQVQEIGSTKAGEMVVQFKDKVYAIPASKTAQIRQSGAENARAKVLGFNDSIKLLNGKTVKVGEDGAQQATGRVRTMDGAIFGLKDKTVKVEEIGATASGDRVFNLDGKIYALNGKAVDVRANVHGLWDVGALAGSIAGLQSKTVTVTAITKKIASSMHADGGIMESAGGGLHQTFADGGFAGRIGSQQPQIRRAGGEGILWAEEGAGPWEAFISGHPAKSARSKQIWLETGRRLGMVEAYADGGVRQHANRTYVTPQPRVTVQAPAQASAAIDSRAIGAAVAAQVGAELRGWQPMVQIGDRQFFGQLQRTTANRKGR